MVTSIDAGKSRPFVVDQNRIDLTWERTQEQAMNAFWANKPAVARQSWAKALDIAERHFDRGDPRLAASLSNHAFALLRLDQIHQANLYFRRAVNAWEDSWRWVPQMAPSCKPGEVGVPYDPETQDTFYALIKQGQAITETLWRERSLPEVEGDDWSTVKPPLLNDIRRLTSAIFLMPTARSRWNPSLEKRRQLQPAG